MGLLTAIGAIGGTLIGGPAGAKIGAGLGAAADGLVGGSATKKAGNQATAAQIAANEQNRAIYGQNFGRAEGLLNPIIERGGVAGDAYAAGLGLPAGGAGGGNGDVYDWNAYLGQYGGDAAREADRVVGNDPRFPTREAYAQWHYENYGQQDGRPLPTVAGADGAQPAVGADGVNPVGPNNFGPQIEDRPALTRPDVGARPTFNRPDVQPFSYGREDYTESPGFKFQLERGVDAVASNAALGGNLKSGAATKSALDFAQNLAYRDFANERGFAYGQYTDDRNFGNANFNSDRAFGNNVFENDRSRSDANYTYDANRSDTNYSGDRAYDTSQFSDYYNRLGGVASQGYGAAGQLVGAGNDYSRALAGINSSNADATGNNLLYQANQSNQMWNNIGQGLGYAAGVGGAGGNGGAPVPTPQPGYGGSSYSAQLNPSAQGNYALPRTVIPYL